MKRFITHLLFWAAALGLAMAGYAQTNDSTNTSTNITTRTRPKLDVSAYPAPDAPTLEQETNGGISPVVQQAMNPPTNLPARAHVSGVNTNTTNAAVPPGPLVVGPMTAPHPVTPVEASITAFTNNTPLSKTMPTGVSNAIVLRDTNELDAFSDIKDKLQLAAEQRHQKDFIAAAQILESVLTNEAPSELHRQALFDRALVAQDAGEPVRTQQIWAHYIHLYSDDPSVPEVYLRQGLLYRDMGAHSLAISKFYAVMSSALKPQLSNMDYYKKLVIQAETEIAETYFLDGQFEESAKDYNKILLAADADQNREPLELRLIRAMSRLTNTANYIDTIARAQNFLAQHATNSDVPEVRFMLASTLNHIGRNQESMFQISLLLKAEQSNIDKAPETWLYWQRRAGNEIANQLYKLGDYVNALQIYLNLADIDKRPEWQIPVWYQTALDYEQLQQWQMAADTYTQIINRQKDLTDAANSSMLSGVIDMAKWRRDYLGWQQKARESSLALHYAPLPPTNAVPVTAH
jgi:tetratricopeptide (TPR) repeat protein